jgi:threonine dehydratase
VGTEFVEIIGAVPDLNAVILPVGAGNEAAAAVTVLKSQNPDIDIYAVQAKSSDAAYRSWQAGEIL